MLNSILKFYDNCIFQMAKNSGYPKSVVHYSVRLWMMSFIQALIICLYSAIFFDIKYFFAFLIIFFPARLLVDGYHCKSIYTCTIFSTIIFTGICLLSIYTVKSTVAVYVIIFVYIILLIAILIKIVKMKNKKRFKYDLASLFMGVAVLLLFLINRNVYILNGMYSYMMVFVLSIPIILTGGEKCEE